jgi:parallel beta-helix repeat protein
MKTRYLTVTALLLAVLLAGCITEKQPKENEPFEEFSSEKTPTYKQPSQMEKNTEKASINETYHPETKTIDTCMEITEAGYYVISTSISSSNSCIIIKANDVVVDGKYHEVTGPFDFLKYKDKETNKEKIKEMAKRSGIIAIDVENITIKNIRIGGWEVGIRFENVKNVKLEGIVAEDNIGPGISIFSFSNVLVENCLLNRNDIGLEAIEEHHCDKIIERPEMCPMPEKYSENLTVINCVANDNKIDGFHIGGVKKFTFRNCIANHNDGGIYPMFSKEGIIENCTANFNELVGICLINSESITILNSTTNYNTAGIRFEGRNITVKGCSIKNNELDGIFIVWKSYNNKITDNLIENNGNAIRIIEYSENNIVKNNTCKNNAKDIGIRKETVNFVEDNYCKIRYLSEDEAFRKGIKKEK